MSLSDDLRSIPALFGDAIEQLGKLVSNEVRLARAEISEKASAAGLGLAYLAGAGILLIPALVLLLLALAIWLVERGLSPATAHLVAGAVAAGVSIVLGIVGVNRLKPKALMPSVTVQQIERDVAAVKEVAR